MITLTAQQVRAGITPHRARELIAEALGGFDPADDPPRTQVPVAAGHLLLMPSAGADYVGVKVASVAPGNPAAGLPRIQATYLLMDAATLTPVATLDASVLTEVRTAAVSAFAADHLASAGARDLVVIGTGPQARSHLRALADVRAFSRLTVIGRDPARAAQVVDDVRGESLDVEVGTLERVQGADVIVCATSSADPLFDGGWVRAGACVIAIGSHQPGKRELDETLMARAQVVVEDRQTARREAGDVIAALDAGVLDGNELLTLRDLALGQAGHRTDVPNVFKGTGMAWQDLAIAAGIVRAHLPNG